jgi:hypothetical protein
VEDNEHCKGLLVPHETSFDYGIDSQALSPSYIVALEQEGSHGLAVAGHGLSAALERRMGDCMAVCLGLYLALYFSATTQDCHVIHTNTAMYIPYKRAHFTYCTVHFK